MSGSERVSAEALALLSRVLSGAWEELNQSYFHGELKAPALEIRPLGRQLGRWERHSRQIVLSEKLIFEHRWGVVLEVLKHEMVHQFVHEGLGRVEEPPHGPSFQAECARLGIDARASGLPPVSEEDPKRDKILGRVQRLLALAGSDNIHEAKAAMRAAQRLMLRYNIDQMEAERPTAMAFEQVGAVRQRHPTHVKILSGILGEHFFVRCIWVFAFDVERGRKGRVLELCGTPANLAIAAYVHDFVLVTSERLWAEHKAREGIRSNAERRRFLSGVMMGFSESLSTQAVEHGETGLVWLGDPRLDVYLRQRHPRIRSGGGSRMRVTREWQAGRAAGRKLVVHRPLEGKKRRGIRGLLTRR
jgi:hypothetical protein